MTQTISRKPIERDWELLEDLKFKIEQVQNGDIDFLEAGDWFYSNGWSIVKELEK